MWLSRCFYLCVVAVLFPVCAFADGFVDSLAEAADVSGLSVDITSVLVLLVSLALVFTVYKYIKTCLRLL